MHRVAAVGVGVGALVLAAVVPAGAAPNQYRSQAGPSRTHTQPSARPLAVNPGAAVRYAVDKPACAKPSPSGVTCYAVERVPVSRNTPGAYAYSALGTDPSAGPTRGPAGGYTPKDLSSAYHYNPVAKTGRHMTIGIVDWYNDPYALKDLQKFEKHYHIKLDTRKTFVKVNGKGQPNHYPRNNRDLSIEISLDVQTARAVCRKCKIVLVEAKGPNIAALSRAERTAIAKGADVVSNSWGAPEVPHHPLPNRIRKSFHHPGVAITASTADHGWFGWDFANEPSGKSQNAPNWPASDPNVVGVGGTALTLTNKTQRHTETVWNENGLDDSRALNSSGWVAPQPFDASGGGCSRDYKAPSWQRQLKGYRREGCNGHKSAADVAAVGDPATGFDLYDTYEGGWITIGGTSLASPLVASMWALNGGTHGAVNPANSVYMAAKRGKGRVAFDVRRGGNSWCGGDTTNHCQKVLSNETVNSSTGKKGNGNPNGLENQSGGAGGLKDCSFPWNFRRAKPHPRSSECNAVRGFDGTAGLGTPKGLALFRATNPTLHAKRPVHVYKGVSQLWKAHGKPRIAHDRIVSYFWSWGDHTHTKTKKTRVRHKYKHTGFFHVSVMVTDKYGQKTQVSAVIRVGKHRRHHHRSAAYQTIG